LLLPVGAGVVGFLVAAAVLEDLEQIAVLL
jgi:hypothetical protein